MSQSSRRYLFSSESVTEGHPDKVADQISDAILDAVLVEDPQGRVACETLVTADLTIVAGEITTTARLDVPAVARQTIREAGYIHAQDGFDYKTCEILSYIKKQSEDIAMGVDTGGAGDQGMMFGFACDETEELMPMPIMLAHKLCKRLAAVRKEKVLDYLRSDGKSQVTIEYINGRPARVDTVVVSAHHRADVVMNQLRADVMEHVILPVIPSDMLDKHTRYHINPTGSFATGGPKADAGLTGRKTIVDTYGGIGHHGGGSFSGKDPTKVDRSGAYMARYIAKNLVAAGLARRLEVQIAYAIGVAEPVSVMVETFGTGAIDEEQMVELVRAHFPLTPRGIIDTLQLRRPIYKQTAAYGHFGRTEPSFTWERRDKAEQIRKDAGLGDLVAAQR